MESGPIVQDDVLSVQSIKDKPSNSLLELRYENCEDYDNEDQIICQGVWCESIPSLEPRFKSYLNPLLKPIENLAQWKALKSKDVQVEDSNYQDDDEDQIICQQVWFESIPVPLSSSEPRLKSSLNPLLKPIENLAQWKALK